ncbi:7073_t:CDS:2 [Entrophospora sp. SA101]|nr:7073_t:CDS:2 [Entrophospora sp. SA101]
MSDTDLSPSEGAAQDSHYSTSNNKNSNNRQVSLSEFYESTTLTKEREESINKSLIRAFRSEREQNILLEQLRNYKLRNSSYNSPFSFESGNVLNWWYTCEEDHDYLQEFAIKLFSVVPHSATCERSFSILDWYYGKKRQNLNITTIENMLKIHSYHLSNTEKELKYVGQNISDEELKNLISNAKLCVSDDISESESDFYEVEPNYKIDKKNNFM